MKADKKALRRQILQVRDAMSPTERERASLLLTERILGHQWFYLSDAVLGFACFGSEIDTDEILREALRTGKRLYLPRVEGEDMTFYRVQDLDELQKGYKDIREPAAGGERYVYAPPEADSVLMLLPGVAFDVGGGRMGYGKGFYDRFLWDKPGLRLRTIGVGFRCQLVESVPRDEGDVTACQVICM